MARSKPTDDLTFQVPSSSASTTIPSLAAIKRDALLAADPAREPKVRRLLGFEDTSSKGWLVCDDEEDEDDDDDEGRVFEGHAAEHVHDEPGPMGHLSDHGDEADRVQAAYQLPFTAAYYRPGSPQSGYYDSPIASAMLARHDSILSTHSDHSSLAAFTAAAGAEHLPAFLRSIYGETDLHTSHQQSSDQHQDVAQVPCVDTHDMFGLVAPEHLRLPSPLDLQPSPRDESPFTPQEEKPQSIKKPRAKDSVWWQRKNYVCDFQTTNVELYRWHTTHLKAQDQRAMAEVRAAAAYACEPLTTPKSPSSDLAPTAPSVPPSELGLHVDPVSSLLILSCPAAFAVKSRLSRHINGKNPQTWNRNAQLGEYSYTDDTGTRAGTLGDSEDPTVTNPIITKNDGAHQHGGPPETGVKASGKPGKRRKPFSFERVLFRCAWPLCGKTFSKKSELQEHAVGVHNIPVPIVMEKRVWRCTGKFTMVPAEPSSARTLSLPTTPPSSQADSTLVRQAVRVLMVPKLTRAIQPAPPSSSQRALVPLKASLIALLKDFVNSLDMASLEPSNISSSPLPKHDASAELSETSVPVPAVLQLSSPNARLRAHAQTLAAGTRPTPEASALEIDHAQLPFPTHDELATELGISQSTEDGAECRSKILERWCAQELAPRACVFVDNVRKVELDRRAKGLIDDVEPGILAEPVTPAAKVRQRAPRRATRKPGKENKAPEEGKCGSFPVTPITPGLPITAVLDGTPVPKPSKNRRPRTSADTVSRVIAAAAREREKRAAEDAAEAAEAAADEAPLHQRLGRIDQQPSVKNSNTKEAHVPRHPVLSPSCIQTPRHSRGTFNIRPLVLSDAISKLSGFGTLPTPRSTPGTGKIEGTDAHDNVHASPMSPRRPVGKQEKIFEPF
ncbi:hypothetical protein HKX48_005126 [Thoreauomyces humboldtii]|nr:hypothetical protein HKX48_005126 [Thoreauomyces humboldtii]